MQDLEALAVRAAGSAAQFMLVFHHMITASCELAQSTHRASGTSAYAALRYAPEDVDDAATELEMIGSQLVGELLQRMERGSKYGKRYRFRHAAAGCMQREADEMVEDDPGHTYAAVKESQHPSTWATPLDWLKLIADLPMILEQLAVHTSA